MACMIQIIFAALLETRYFKTVVNDLIGVKFMQSRHVCACIIITFLTTYNLNHNERLFADFDKTSNRVYSHDAPGV